MDLRPSGAESEWRAGGGTPSFKTFKAQFQWFCIISAGRCTNTGHFSIAKGSSGILLVLEVEVVVTIGISSGLFSETLPSLSGEEAGGVPKILLPHLGCCCFFLRGMQCLVRKEVQRMA